MDHGKKKMKMQEGGNTTRKKRGMQNKKRMQEEAEKKVVERRTRGQIKGKKGPSFPKAPPKSKKTGPRMSDIMGGARGPKGPLGGAIDSPKAEVKKKKKPLRPLKFRNLAGQKFGQRKAGGTIKKMKGGGMMKPVDKEKNPGLAKLPTEVRNKMGFMKKGGLMAAIKKVDAEKMYGGGMTKKKMMGGGMTVKKMKHGGTAGKCPRDGIAMRGKTKAGRKTT